MNVITILIATAICLLGAICQTAFILVEHKEKYLPAVILKGSASLIFVLAGVYFATLGNGSNGTGLVIAGLICGMLGDILLNLRFVFPKAGQKIFFAGIAVFLAGHILYLVELMQNCQAIIGATVCGIALAGALLTWIFRSFPIKMAFKIFGVVYIGAVSLMACTACAILFHTVSTHTILFALGAVAFLVSDVVLIFNTFGPTTKFSMRITNLSLYYLGQLLIALCLSF